LFIPHLWVHIDGFHSIFSLLQLEGIVSPCCLLIASHDIGTSNIIYGGCDHSHSYAMILKMRVENFTS